MAWPFPTFPIQGSRLVSEFRGDFNELYTALISSFTGPDAPNPAFAGMMWVDTSVSPRVLKQRNSLNTGWIIRARVDSDYGGTLPLVGGTMEGGINMQGYPISNLPLGAGNSPARYADLGSYSRIDGSVPFIGIPSLPDQDPSLPNQIARKDYVDRTSKSGGTFTGQISLPVAASTTSQAMRKQEFDEGLNLHNHAEAYRTKVPAAGIVGSSTIGQALQTVSAATAQWAAPCGINNSPVQLFSITGAVVADTLVDLTGRVATYSRMAILLVNVTQVAPDSRYLRLYVRSASNGAQTMYCNGGVYAARFLALVPLDPPPAARQFYYSADVQGAGSSACSMTVYILAWL